jgi:hypothetical protein
MTDQHIITFQARGGLHYAFLGVHVVGLASETGKWMFALDGDATWRRSKGDLEGAKAAIIASAREWYDAAHQPLAPGQAERLCAQPARLLRPKREIKINEIDLEAVSLRIKRDGVVTTYVMPPVVDGIEAPQETILSIRSWCIGAQATAQAKCRAMPADQLAEHELGVFTGIVRLIDALRSSTIIRDELRRIATERAEVEHAARPDQGEQESTRVDEEAVAE